MLSEPMFTLHPARRRKPFWSPKRRVDHEVTRRHSRKVLSLIEIVSTLNRNATILPSYQIPTRREWLGVLRAIGIDVVRRLAIGDRRRDRFAGNNSAPQTQ